MSLADLKIGQKAKIIYIDTDSALKQRLRVFGIIKNETVVTVAESIWHQNIKILIGTFEVALRTSEAMQIKVEIL